jgi:hypothetical protein
VPSIGGGRKLIRTLLAGEGENVCSGVGEGGKDCSGEIEGEGDSAGVGEGVGVGDSCASTKEDKMAIAKARLTLIIMSSEVEISLTVLNETSNIERFDSLAFHSLSLRPSRPSRGFPSRSILDFARNDRG